MLIFYDENNTVTGLQTFPDHSDKPHIVVSDELINKLAPLIGSLMLSVDADGNLSLPVDLETHYETAAFSDMKSELLQLINDRANQHLNAIKREYPVSEIESWPKQEQEARAYLSDNTAHAPLITALASTRDINLDELARRIITKADAYSILVGQLVGQRQKCEDSINSAETMADLQAINDSL